MKVKWFAGFALVVALVYSWGASGSNGTFATREAQDFYGFLTDAFLSGQTYLKVAPNPALQNLANPWAGAQGIPRLHDASYFHGRYYIYFGPPPVLLLLLPWRLVTGTFLAQGLATLVFGVGGTLLAGLLLLWAWARWFAKLPTVWLALGLLLVAFATRALVLVEDSSVYQVPITCAYFCLMAALCSIAWAISAKGRRVTIALGLASLAWGLAVSSRPDYFFSLIALLVPLRYLTRRVGSGAPPIPGGRLRLAAATLLPAAVIGCGIAAYNYVRFEDITQFGMKYQFTAADQRFLKFFAPESLFSNLDRYVFSHPFYTPYFPFITAGENWGILFCTPFAVLGLLWPLTLRGSKLAAEPGWTAWSLTLLVALIPNMLLLSMLAIANERYFLDFLPLAVLSGVVVGWGLIARLRRAATKGAWLSQALIFGLAIWTVGQGVLMAFRSTANPDQLRPLARVADRMTAAVESWRGTRYGPWLFQITFPVRPQVQREPLLTGGHGGDVLYVEYPDPSHIRVGFFHAGSGGPVSDPVPVIPGKSYQLKVDLGALYPPKEHPLLAAWPSSLADVLLHRLEVALDGRTILHGAVAYYPTFPGDIRLGQNPGGLYAPEAFSGKLVSEARPGIPTPESLRGPPGEGSVRMVVRFPTFDNFRHEPLVSTGHRGAGDLLYVAYVSTGVIRLGIDSWGSGGLESAPLEYNPNQDQVIEADLASLHPRPGSRQLGTLALRFNGQLVLFARRPFNASSAEEVVFGFNGCESSTASATFSGSIVRTERIGAVAAPPPVAEGTGPIQMVLRFPQDYTNYSQPLLATGRPNAGDLIFVHYLDDHRLSIGYAHDGAPAIMGHPIAVDYGATHAINLSLGSLYPPAADPAWQELPATRRVQAGGTISVTLDGQPALLVPQAAFPAARGETIVGQNATAASDCGPAFTGTLLVAQRLALANLMTQAGAMLVPDIQDGSGPVKIALRFPTGRPGRNEPLLVTGRTGAGDVIYVHYVDEHHVRLGYDHWNVGGPLSDPLEVDYASTHLLELSLGSLYPPLADASWGSIPIDRRQRMHSTVLIKLDGQAALRAHQTAYPAAPREINAAANPIGASTCDEAFTGELIQEQRLDPAAGPP